MSVVTSAAKQIAESYEREDRNRSIYAKWLLHTDDEGKRHYAVLTCLHQKDTNIFSGEFGKKFTASLARQTEEDRYADGRKIGTMRGFTLFSGVGIASEPVERFSKKRLETFFQYAMSELANFAEHEKVVQIFDSEQKI